MMELTMCGYCCDLCKAYIENIRKKDERKALSDAWKKYFGFDIPAESITCDGCRCMREDAKRVDSDCMVRACVMQKHIAHCGLCAEYPCDLFAQRKGLSCAEAKEKLGDSFNQEQYDAFLLAYDNVTRLNEVKKRGESCD